MVTKGPAGNSKPFITGCLAGGFRDQVWRVAGRAHLTALDILTIPILHRFPAGVVGEVAWLGRATGTHVRAGAQSATLAASRLRASRRIDGRNWDGRDDEDRGV